MNHDELYGAWKEPRSMEGSLVFLRHAIIQEKLNRGAGAKFGVPDYASGMDRSVWWPLWHSVGQAEQSVNWVSARHTSEQVTDSISDDPIFRRTSIVYSRRPYRINFKRNQTSW